jgi:hypothetical protein
LGLSSDSDRVARAGVVGDAFDFGTPGVAITPSGIVAWIRPSPL